MRGYLMAGVLFASVMPNIWAESEMPAEEGGVSVELAVGYDSHYVAFGEELFKDTVWGQIDASVTFAEKWTLEGRVWYAEVDGEAFNEVDYTSALWYDAGICDVGVGFLAFHYPRGAEGGGVGATWEQEMSVWLSKSLGPVEVTYHTSYNLQREGFYTELELSGSVELTQWCALEPLVAIGYGHDYFETDGPTHALAALGLPVKLSDQWTLRPYVAANMPLRALDDAQDLRLLGGVSMSFSF